MAPAPQQQENAEAAQHGQAGCGGMAKVRPVIRASAPDSRRMRQGSRRLRHGDRRRLRGGVASDRSGSHGRGLLRSRQRCHRVRFAANPRGHAQAERGAQDRQFEVGLVLRYHGKGMDRILWTGWIFRRFPAWAFSLTAKVPGGGSPKAQVLPRSLQDLQRRQSGRDDSRAPRCKHFSLLP